jgi:predicted HAD superfamily phosphohydrolase
MPLPDPARRYGGGTAMKQEPKRVFVTDCEGPVTKNDNAAELAARYIPRGDRFFARISLYDDYLAEVVRRPGYKPGDTLRLILPFFKAFGLDNDTMTEFCRENIEMIPSADRVLREISALAPAYIVSTSYTPYIRAVCDAIDFPLENTFRTEVDLDAYALSEHERDGLKEIHARIMDLPDFEIPSGAESAQDLSEPDRKTVAVLDEIFWTELPRTEIYAIIRDVNPIGGREKAAALDVIAAKEKVSLSDVIYFGDSITDVDAFRLVRSAGGLAVSFNGNGWAVREAGIAVTAYNALPIGWLAALFLERGAEAFEDLFIDGITAENRDAISARSGRVRKEVRSEIIGSLG